MGEQDKNIFDIFSPTDYRYAVAELKPYLTEKAFIKYKLKVEVALVKVLVQYKVCPEDVLKEVIKAVNPARKISSNGTELSNGVTAKEVYAEENRIKHDIRALVNCIRNRISVKAKPYVHFLATSYDIVDTANILRYKEATYNVILPDMIELEKIWISLALRFKDTLQIGRTHGQHAEPITFGFALAQYVNRWGERILFLKEAVDKLVGKFSGAVGAYNATCLFFSEPEEFEKAVLQELGLRPAKISTQIVPPEPTVDFFHAIISAFSVLANFSDDMRHLQRSEIAEVGEAFEEDQVGSSTMPQKRNPINFENVKSMYKAFMPRIVSVYMDQISEHQRDLTNSCTARYCPEFLVAFSSSIRRLTKVCRKLQVDEANMLKNFKMNQDIIIAEPLYILLASLGHPDAHEYVKRKTQEALKMGRSLYEIVKEDENLKSYLDRFSPLQKEIIKDPSRYIGMSLKKSEKITQFWQERLKDLLP